MARYSNGESTFSRIAKLLEQFTPQQPDQTVGALADRTGMSVPTASRLVAELVDHGWLQRTPQRRVRLGVGLWHLAAGAAPYAALRRAAAPELHGLHQAVGHDTVLAVLDGGEVHVIDRLCAPEYPPRTSELPDRYPVHASAAGLALLAVSAPEVKNAVLAGGLPAYTRETPTDPATLRIMLDAVRRRGVAVAPGYLDADITEIAAPIRIDGGHAAMSALIPREVLAPGIVHAVVRAARRVEATVAPGALARI